MRPEQKVSFSLEFKRGKKCFLVGLNSQNIQVMLFSSAFLQLGDSRNSKASLPFCLLGEGHLDSIAPLISIPGSLKSASKLFYGGIVSDVKKQKPYQSESASPPGCHSSCTIQVTGLINHLQSYACWCLKCLIIYTPVCLKIYIYFYYQTSPH